MSNKDKVQIKLVFEGEMLRILQDICEEECRTITQQIQYIVKSYIKSDLANVKISNTKNITQLDRNITEIDIDIDNDIKNSIEKDNKDEFDYISNEMLNF